LRVSTMAMSPKMNLFFLDSVLNTAMELVGQTYRPSGNPQGVVRLSSLDQLTKHMIHIKLTTPVWCTIISVNCNDLCTPHAGGVNNRRIDGLADRRMVWCKFYLPVILSGSKNLRPFALSRMIGSWLYFHMSIPLTTSNVHNYLNENKGVTCHSCSWCKF
jgi:hypothetical protein